MTWQQLLNRHIVTAASTTTHSLLLRRPIRRSQRSRRISTTAECFAIKVNTTLPAGSLIPTRMNLLREVQKFATDAEAWVAARHPHLA